MSRLQPKRSTGFLFKNPFKTEAAFTESDLGIRIVFSSITKNQRHNYLFIRNIKY